MASSCTPATSWERGTTDPSSACRARTATSLRPSFTRRGSEVQTELDVFRQLCHPNIVVADGVVTSHMEVGLLLEKGCGNFGKYLRGLPLREPLDPKKVFQRWQLSSQLAQGLRHVHSRGLVHGDPKPSNAIVFEAPLAAKWSDFGLSHKIGEKVLSENVYTAVYRAPELVSGKVVRLKQSADAFAFGCVLFSSCCVGSSAHLFPEVSLLGNQQFVQSRVGVSVPRDPIAQQAIKALVRDEADRASIADFLSVASRRLASA